MSVLAPPLAQRRIMLIAVVFGAAFVLFFPARQLVEQRSQIGELEQRLVELRTENDRLDEQVRRLSDPAELEVLARERLGLVRPGERAYFVEPVEPRSTPVPDKPHRASSWERAWEWLTGLVRGRD